MQNRLRGVCGVVGTALAWAASWAFASGRVARHQPGRKLRCRGAPRSRPAARMSKADAQAGRRDDTETLTIDGCEVTISNPRKVLFPDVGYTKLDLVHYYLAVAEGALLGAGGSMRSCGWPKRST